MSIELRRRKERREREREKERKKERKKKKKERKKEKKEEKERRRKTNLSLFREKEERIDFQNYSFLSTEHSSFFVGEFIFDSFGF